MRKLIMWNLVTLDGMFEGEKPWDLWWHEQVWGPELEAFSIEQLERADFLLFGRRTYEGMAAYWRSEEGTVAGFMNRLPKLVASRTLRAADWNGSRVLQGDAMAQLRRIKAEGDGDIYVFGSGVLCESLLRERLFDELRIGLAPFIAGKGRALFTPALDRQRLRLEESRELSNGCLILRYRP